MKVRDLIKKLSDYDMDTDVQIYYVVAFTLPSKTPEGKSKIVPNEIIQEIEYFDYDKKNNILLIL